MLSQPWFLGLGAALVIAAGNAWALDGQIGGAPLSLEGGVTVVYQDTDADGVSAELTASADLVAALGLGPGSLVVYVEGATRPESGGVAAFLGEANADAGSAADDDGDGRVQISELFYALPWRGATYRAGLMDASALLDASEFANDETSQFIGATFVNNPTIAFPDYTLALSYERQSESERGYGWAAWLGSSHGLADDGATYAQLFDRRFDADGDGSEESSKGIFVGVEGSRSLEALTARLGVWAQTADNPRVSGGGSESNFGVYAGLDWAYRALGVNARAGAANPEVSQAAGFVSIAAQYVFTVNLSGGAGFSHTFLSGEDAVAGNDAVSQAELYLKYEPFAGVHLTPHVQWINHSGFDGTRGSDRVAGVRLGVGF